MEEAESDRKGETDGSKAKIEARSPEEPETEELESAIRKLSDQKPEVASEFMAMMGAGPMTNPLHRKMDGEHITQLLELAAEHDEREYNLHKTSQQNEAESRRENRKYFFWTFIVIAILFVVVLFMFRNKPDILIPALTGLGGLVSGFLGGWGIGRQRQT